MGAHGEGTDSMASALWGTDERTQRVEVPTLGPDEMLNFDWSAFSHDGANSYVPPAERADAQIALATQQAAQQAAAKPHAQADVDVSRKQLSDLTDNIVELKNSIKELRQERAKPSSGEHLMLVSDALVALTKTAQPVVPAKPVMSAKKVARMARNRVSAQESRERKRRYTQDLETRVKELEAENVKYKTSAEELQKRVEELRGEVQELKKAKLESAE